MTNATEYRISGLSRYPWRDIYLPNGVIPAKATRIRYRSPITRRVRSRYVEGLNQFVTALVMESLAVTGNLPTMDDVRSVVVEMDPALEAGIAERIEQVNFPMVVKFIGSLVKRGTPLDEWAALP